MLASLDLHLPSTARPNELSREIHEGLQVVENYNSGNKDLHYGRGSDLTAADEEHVEVFVLTLNLLQAALMHLNTTLDPNHFVRAEWTERITADDRRAVTPLFCTHVNLYGKVDLNMTTRLHLGTLLAMQGVDGQPTAEEGSRRRSPRRGWLQWRFPVRIIGTQETGVSRGTGQLYDTASLRRTRR